MNQSMRASARKGLESLGKGSQHSLNSLHLRDKVAQHIFDTIFKGDCGAWTPRARSLHMEVNDTVTKSAKDNISTVTGNGWPNSRINKLFDLCDKLCIFRIKTFFITTFLKPCFEKRARRRSGAP